MGFYPVNEETVFMDPPASNIMSSNQGHNWLIYGNSNSSTESTSSGDEYCCGQHTVVNSEDTSSDLDVSSECPLKRNNRHMHRLHLYEHEHMNEEEEEEMVEVSSNVSKRMKACEDVKVDVRMIDFAHTTFSQNGSMPIGSNCTVHQGPDGGFLMGLDSLKRLLMEILTEG